MKYRAEIDGLRALAVIPVILFHAGYELFGGGYVGVDVFFVISGFLITTILIEDLKHDRFSIVNFYERRARRILPVLCVVLLTCIPFAWMLMTADQMKLFSQSLVAVSFFSSNILYWWKTDYFSPASETNPLLHTWSLAVEEQFYLVFPVLLFVLWRSRNNNVLSILVILTLISLALSEYSWRNHTVANFFLAPTRVWELLAGSIAAIIAQNRSFGGDNKLSFLGFFSILFSIFIYDKSTPFPSLYTLLPVIGTTLLLLYAKKKTYVGRMLSTKLFVFMGLISYSAYLWHQPLFSFARLYIQEPPSHLTMALLSIATIALSALSWRYVEQPFRNKNIINRKTLVLCFSTFMVVFITLGLTGQIKDGFADLSWKDSVAKFRTTPTLSSDFWVLGDSHGAHLVEGLKNATTGNVKDLSSNGCIPLRNVDRYDSRFQKGDCARFINTQLDIVIDTDPDAIIVLSSMGPVYLDGTTFNGKDMARVTGLGVELINRPEINDKWSVYEIGLRDTLAELSSLHNTSVVVVIDVPELGIDNGCQPNRKLINTRYFNLGDAIPEPNYSNCFVDRLVYEKRSTRYKTLVKSIASEFPTINVFDPTNHFCDDSICKGFIDQIGFLYKDPDHLSEEGSNYWSHVFSAWMLSSTRQPGVIPPENGRVHK